MNEMQQPFSGMMLFHARFYGTSTIPKGAKIRTLQRNTRNKFIITSVLAFLISGYLQLTVLYFDNFHPFCVFSLSFCICFLFLGWMVMTLEFSFLSVVISLVKIISFFITISAVGLSCLKLVVHSSV